MKIFEIKNQKFNGFDIDEDKISELILSEQLLSGDKTIVSLGHTPYTNEFDLNHDSDFILVDHDSLYIIDNQNSFSLSKLLPEDAKRMIENGTDEFLVKLVKNNRMIGFEQWTDNGIHKIKKEFHNEKEILDFIKTHPNYGMFVFTLKPFRLIMTNDNLDDNKILVGKLKPFMTTSAKNEWLKHIKHYEENERLSIF